MGVRASKHELGMGTTTQSITDKLKTLAQDHTAGSGGAKSTSKTLVITPHRLSKYARFKTTKYLTIPHPFNN